MNTARFSLWLTNLALSTDSILEWRSGIQVEACPDRRLLIRQPKIGKQRERFANLSPVTAKLVA